MPALLWWKATLRGAGSAIYLEIGFGNSDAAQPAASPAAGPVTSPTHGLLRSSRSGGSLSSSNGSELCGAVGGQCLYSVPTIHL